MELKERQAVAFVHRDRAHTHVHLYVNRIGFEGRAYNDSFIGKRSQGAAEKVAREMGLTTVRDVQLGKELDSYMARNEIRDIHQKVMRDHRPKELDAYIHAMRAYGVNVVPTINKASRLQGFRMEHQGESFKASEVHRSMSGGRILAQVSWNKGIRKTTVADRTVKLLGKSVEMSGNLAVSVAKNLIKKTVKRAIDTGFGIGY